MASVATGCLCRSLFQGEASTKISANVPRTQSLEETEARVLPKFRAYGITRLADLTPLDRLSIPVFCATTPLARDLTTHMGKGLTERAARLSCIMEAVERLTAEAAPGPTVRTTWSHLAKSGRPALDPRSLSPTQFDPDLTLSWISGTDLSSGAELLLPADMVLSPPHRRADCCP